MDEAGSYVHFGRIRGDMLPLATSTTLDFESDRSSDLDRGLTGSVKLDITLFWEHVFSPVLG